VRPFITNVVLPAIARQLELRGRPGVERTAERAARRLRRAARRPDHIDRRLARLDTEWDVERTLELVAGSVGLAGVLLGSFVNKRFFAFTAVASGFLVQHALLGWCPPSLVLQQLGVRTADEIARERYALKAMRGDFRGAGAGRWSARAERALRAIRA